MNDANEDLIQPIIPSDISEDLIEPIIPSDISEEWTDAYQKRVNKLSQAAVEPKPYDHETEVRKLEAIWGPRDGYEYRTKMLVSESAAHRVLMIHRQTLDRIQDAIGFAEISNLFFQVGVALGISFTIRTAAISPDLYCGR